MKYFIFLLIILTHSEFTSTSGQNNSILTLPDTSITYAYDTNGDSLAWTKTLRKKDSDTIRIITQKFDGERWNNETQVKYTSDFFSTTELAYTWSGLAWIPDTRTIKIFEQDYIAKESRDFYSSKTTDWVCSEKIEYFRDVYFGVDSVYTYKINPDSSDLELVTKEYRTNCYDKPVQALLYCKSEGATWLLTGKTEYMYNEENHDVTETYYSHTDVFEPDRKIFTDYDENGRIALQQELNWQKHRMDWSGVKMYVKKQNGSNFTEEINYRFNDQNWEKDSKTVRYPDTDRIRLITEQSTWIDSLNRWSLQTKTFDKSLTTNTITINNTTMDEQVYLTDRSIIIQNDKYSRSSYSLYSLGGSLLQKGTIAQNHIDIDPKIQEQTLVLILMSHSAIFSKKLHFMQ
ncbi:hypothetical protein ACE1ET_01605 [Saccharicrinis sp. FJH62]|uniref:hypothetical protein n=1 Tax=Saccharicrinis sp. FJH62 TaxID=3344657 RepID=UPI0035D47E5B